MKGTLIQLAKEKGFESSFLYNYPMKYSNNEENRWLFWLTELNSWLKKEHGIYIQPLCLEDANGITDSTFEINVVSISKQTYILEIVRKGSHVDALADASMQTLLLLK